MDSNDPSNPNSNNPGGQPSGFPPTLGQPSAPLPDSGQVISDVPQLPPSMTSAPIQPAPSFTTSAPETPAAGPAPAAPVNTWDQSPSQPAANPWDTPAQAPADPLAQTPAAGSAWPSSTVETPTDVPTAPPATAEPSNPFLQPQAGASFSIPQTPLDPNQQTAPVPAASEGTPNQAPNPVAATSTDPLNTAFNPAGTAPPNPFASTQAPTDPQNLGVPAQGLPPAGGPPTTDPWGQPTQQPPQIPTTLSAEPGSTGFVPTPSENYPGSAQPGTIPGQGDNAVIQDQAISANPQNNTLDLSSLQNSPAMPAEATSAPDAQANPPQNPPPAPPVTPPPTMAAENAPTDLSHLIAGDEQQPNQPMGNVYAPPVASDQPAGAPAPQTPATEGGSAQPPEKHLNLTKVLLVAGIPIILIVAALSAYLILGVGQAAPEPDTSLPVEQTEQTQAPLTNPPPQIVAPSPQAIQQAPALPEPTLPDSTLPTSSPIASPPLSTPTSAMDRLRAQQSPSPAASTTPAASTSPNSLSLPN